jgi:imidazole glycerol-phosphate synthase
MIFAKRRQASFLCVRVGTRVNADMWTTPQNLIFPGVGAFQTAIEHLRSRGLFEPLREYILSGKPYFGICIGMQVLFESSTESPGTKGLAIIPYPIEQFHSSDKSVPHIGWNAIQILDDPNDVADERSSYYFAHSYRAKYDTDCAEWAHSVTQYGSESFVASVRKHNLFAVQFHPEKSGPAGLSLLSKWLSKPEFGLSNYPDTSRKVAQLKPRHGLTKRIIACMDVRTNDEGDLVVTKGDQYDVREKPTHAANTAGAVRNLGKPIDLAARYAASGADELCLLNITSFRHSPLNDQPMLAVVLAASHQVFVPLTIGGGIKDTVDPDGTKHTALEVAGLYFRAGADKVSIGSEAVYAVERLRANGDRPDGTSAVETISLVYGKQAVVVSVDPRRVYVDPKYDGPFKSEVVFGKPGSSDEGKAWWYQCTVSGGRENRQLSVVQLVQGVQLLGAGEILLNSIDRDGTRAGFDLDLINLVKNAVQIPVIASSGAGTVAHFTQVFSNTDAEAALAAGIFHRREVTIEEVKNALRESGMNVRAL